MTRSVRLALVATVCQALLGLAAVVTSASWQAADTPSSVRSEAPVEDVAVDGGRASAAPDAIGDAATTQLPVPTTAPGKGAGGGGSGGMASVTTTTTTPMGGTTSTTARTGGGSTTTTGPSGPKCPNAKTCDIYKIGGPEQGGPRGGTKGWRPDSDGMVRIRFYVNPKPPAASGLTEETMEAAFLEGTRIIEAANPRIDYVYQGRTTRSQNTLDGVNTFEFGDGTWHRYDNQGYIVESDVGPKAVPAGGWAYTPCEQRDGGCGDSGSGKGEILSMILHEEMHTTGLADLSGEETRELTMNGAGRAPGDRHHVTLGYGDVLGLRALYPTSAPTPPIYTP